MRKKKSFIFERVPRIRDEAVRIELSRAHLLVSLLAVALILTLVIGLVPGYVPDKTLTGIAIALLVLVGIFSLYLGVAVRKRR